MAYNGTLNTDLRDAYGASWFFAKDYIKNAKSNYAKDILSRPFPRVFINQQQIREDSAGGMYAGYSSSDDYKKIVLKDYAELTEGVVCCNAGSPNNGNDLFYDYSYCLSRPNAFARGVKTLVNGYASAMKRDVAVYSTGYTPRIYTLTYHDALGYPWAYNGGGNTCWFYNDLVNNPFASETQTNNKANAYVTLYGKSDNGISRGVMYNGAYLAYSSSNNNVTTNRILGNPQNPKVAQYWVNHAYMIQKGLTGITTETFDGIFADNFNGSANSVPFSSDHKKAQANMCNALKTKIGPNNFLIGNGLPDADFASGAGRDIGMIEDLARSEWTPTKYLSWSDNMITTESIVCMDGCSVLAMYSGGTEYDLEKVRIPLNLLTDNVLMLTSFMAKDISNSGWTVVVRDWTSISSALRAVGKIGYPVEDRVKLDTNTAVYRRRYTHGCVYFNTSTKDVVVSLSDRATGFYKNLAGTTVNSITVPANTGMVLKTVSNTGEGGGTTPVAVAPAKPSSLSLVSCTRTSDTTCWLIVDWNDNSTDEDAFKFYANINSGGYSSQPFKITAQTSSNTIFTGKKRYGIPISATEGVWNVRCTAFNGNGESAPSNEITFQVDAVQVDPVPVTQHCATGVTMTSIWKDYGVYKCSVTWSDPNASPLQPTVVYAIDSTTDWILAGTLASGANELTINLGESISAGTYSFRVDLEGDSTLSSDVYSIYIQPSLVQGTDPVYNGGGDVSNTDSGPLFMDAVGGYYTYSLFYPMAIGAMNTLCGATASAEFDKIHIEPYTILSSMGAIKLSSSNKLIVDAECTTLGIICWQSEVFDTGPYFMGSKSIVNMLSLSKPSWFIETHQKEVSSMLLKSTDKKMPMAVTLMANISLRLSKMVQASLEVSSMLNCTLLSNTRFATEIDTPFVLSGLLRNRQQQVYIDLSAKEYLSVFLGVGYALPTKYFSVPLELGRTVSTTLTLTQPVH